MGISLGKAVDSVLKNDLKWKLGMKLAMLLPIFLTPFIIMDMVKVFTSSPSGKLLLFYVFLLLLWFLVCVYCVCISYGYTLNYIHDVIKNPDAGLPEWKNYNKLFLYGMSFPLCTSTLSCCLTTIMSMASPVANKVPVLMVIFGILFFVLNVFFWLCMPGLQINYCKKLSISDGLDIIEARKYIRKPLFWFILNNILLGIITSTIASILTITVVGVLFVIPLFIFSGLVGANLLGQMYHDVSELNTSVTLKQNNTGGIMAIIVIVILGIGGMVVVSNMSKIIDTVKGITQFGGAMTTSMPSSSPNGSFGQSDFGSFDDGAYCQCAYEGGFASMPEKDIKKSPEEKCEWQKSFGEEDYNNCIERQQKLLSVYKSGKCKCEKQ